MAWAAAQLWCRSPAPTPWAGDDHRDGFSETRPSRSVPVAEARTGPRSANVRSRGVFERITALTVEASGHDRVPQSSYAFPGTKPTNTKIMGLWLRLLTLFIYYIIIIT